MGCIFLSMSSKQQYFSGILVTLLRFLTQMEKMWKDQLFSKILPEKHIQGILPESELK